MEDKPILNRFTHLTVKIMLLIQDAHHCKWCQTTQCTTSYQDKDVNLYFPDVHIHLQSSGWRTVASIIQTSGASHTTPTTHQPDCSQRSTWARMSPKNKSLYKVIRSALLAAPFALWYSHWLFSPGLVNRWKSIHPHGDVRVHLAAGLLGLSIRAQECSQGFYL